MFIVLLRDVFPNFYVIRCCDVAWFIHIIFGLPRAPDPGSASFLSDILIQK